MKIIFFEDNQSANLYPLSLSHPVYMLLFGSSRLYEKWLSALGIARYSFQSRPYLSLITAQETQHDSNSIPDGDCLYLNPRILPSQVTIAAIKLLKPNQGLIVNDFIFALRLGKSRNHSQLEIIENLHSIYDIKRLESSFALKEVKGKTVGYLWDLVALNAEMINSEFGAIKRKSKTGGKVSPKAVLLNNKQILISRNAQIAPGVVIDASHGPVIIGEQTIIEPMTYIHGPAYIGQNCRIVGGRIREGCSFGPTCRVGGEVEESIILGNSNKYHEGFLGHAYLGEWVNLGALTTNSDLKNNYGHIDVAIGDKTANSGQMKVGCFIGDHTKTGIGTMLNTGITVGFSSNIYGAALFTEKRIKSFSWGTPGQLTSYRLDKAMETATKSMERRSVVFTEIHQRLFADINNFDSQSS